MSTPRTGNATQPSFALSRKPWRESDYKRETFMRDLTKVTRKVEPDAKDSQESA